MQSTRLRNFSKPYGNTSETYICLISWATQIHRSKLRPLVMFYSHWGFSWTSGKLVYILVALLGTIFGLSSRNTLNASWGQLWAILVHLAPCLVGICATLPHHIAWVTQASLGNMNMMNILWCHFWVLLEPYYWWGQLRRISGYLCQDEVASELSWGHLRCTFSKASWAILEPS